MQFSTLTKLADFISRAKWMFIYILFSILSLLLGLGYFIASTQAGAQLVLQTLPYFSSYTINYSAVSGTLSRGKLYFHDLHFQSPQIDLYAQSVDIKMSFFKLLLKEIEIEELIIDRPSLIRSIQFSSPFYKKTALDKTVKDLLYKIETSETLSWKNVLPSYSGFDFVINKLHISHLHFVSGNQYYDIDQFTLTHLNTKKNKSFFSHLTMSMPEIKLNINLEKDIKINWNIAIKELNQYNALLKGDIASNGQWQNKPDNHLSFTAVSRQFFFNSEEVSRLNLAFKGRMNAHHITFSFRHKEKDFFTSVNGQLSKLANQTIWQGDVNKLTYTHPKYIKFQPSMGKFKFIFSPEKTELYSNFKLFGNNRFGFQADLSHQQPFNLTGTLLADIKDINPLSLFTTVLGNFDNWNVTHSKGTLKLALQGTLTNPKFIGELVFDNIRSKIHKLNTEITLKKLGFYQLGSPRIQILASGKMGKGDFKLEGHIKKEPINPEIKISLTGSNLLISHTPEYQIYASPNLLLTIDEHSALLSGQLYIPTAHITPQDKSDSVAESEDIILVKNHQRVVSKSIANQSWKKLKTNIDVTLGENIVFEGYGLTTKATGRVIIETRQDNTYKATGKINLINGRYGAFGHYFSLSYGQLLFQSDSILDPKVNIRAERTIRPNMRIKNNASGREDIIVGMQLIGRLSKLQTKLYSNPNFTDREIISYLILGHGQNENTGADGKILMEAIHQLTRAFYPKSKRLTEKKSFYDRLKLDWSIGNSPFHDDTTDALSEFEKKYVNIGKRISDKLYIQYSLGLADKVSVYSIQYLLGNHFVLEAKTDSQSRTAADLLFTFESG